MTIYLIDLFNKLTWLIVDFKVNYKMHMNIRRMAGDRKHHKRSKRLNKVIKVLFFFCLIINCLIYLFLLKLTCKCFKDGTKQNHVSFPEFQQNGSAKQFANGTIMNHLPLRKKKRNHTHKLNIYRRLELGNNFCTLKCNNQKSPL